MFITRALEKGIDVQTIAKWQGHRDGGKLILDTYGHVTSAHTHRMAQMLSGDTPDNVVPMAQAGQSQRLLDSLRCLRLLGTDARNASFCCVSTENDHWLCQARPYIVSN
jgi:hypothetical protein